MAIVHGRSSASALGNKTTEFQAKVHAIKACTAENINKGYESRTIFILSDCQAAIKALEK
jgi:hypothetical protein